MVSEDARVLQRTENAPWLPSGGIAEVIRCDTPPRPMSVVRLLLRRGDDVFCVPRRETGRLDLPMCLAEPDAAAQADDDAGFRSIGLLAAAIVGSAVSVRFVGAVRNVVESPTDGYDWPTPLAHFGVWECDAPPLVDGVWVSLAGPISPLRDRHWYALTHPA